jgi:2-dehydro-3-deoxyphosphogluconate aldolase/(4S)-4-hydroxy-2-oxoglutarate aldolase
MTNDALSTIHRHGVVPVVTVERLEMALLLADALLEGGLPIAEITFRTPAAADVIRRLAEERPELLVGAGTILSIENLRAATRSGARFGVAPGLNPDVVSEAVHLGLPFIPGVATASEIERGLALGCRVLKLFPAALLGGPAMVSALSAPFGHTGVRFMPSSGVTAETLADYIACPTVVAVGGTWIAPKEVIAANDWQEIRRRAQVAREVIARTRGGAPKA